MIKNKSPVTKVKKEKLIYAFVTGSEVMYIGKSDEFKRRMDAYKRAKNSKKRYTNKRVFQGIRESLDSGLKPQIFVLSPKVNPIPTYGDLPIDLVNGLETPFIDKFKPVLNKESVEASPEELKQKREQLKLFRAVQSGNLAMLISLGLDAETAKVWIDRAKPIKKANDIPE